jgi:hypothetical protein
MYHCADTAVLRIRVPLPTGQAHKLAWRALEEKVAPLLTAVPALGRVKSAAQNWFIAQ